MKRYVLFILIFSVALMGMGCAGAPCINSVDSDNPDLANFGGCDDGEYCNTDTATIDKLCLFVMGLGDFISDWSEICNRLDDYGGIGECAPIE